MKRAALHWLLALGLLLSGAAHALGPGAAAPAFELAGLNGPVNLANYRGQLVYLDFWASWCGPCKRSFPWMNELQARYGGQGLRIIAVNLDEQHADAARFLSATPAQFLVALDPGGATARKYAIKGMPSSVLIGRDGKLILSHTGFNDSDKTALEQQIAAALLRKE